MLVVVRRVLLALNDGVIDVDIDEASEPRLKKTRCDPGCRMVAAGGSRSDVNSTDRGVPKAS